MKRPNDRFVALSSFPTTLIGELLSEEKEPEKNLARLFQQLRPTSAKRTAIEAVFLYTTFSAYI
jgi:hypothetical protein